MPPHDNWSPLLTENPEFYWNYIEFINDNFYEVQQLMDESEVGTEEYGMDGWDEYVEENYVRGSGTREDPFDLT